MSRFFAISFCSQLILSGFALGQENSGDSAIAKEALPPGPLIVSQMPAVSRWTVDYAYTDSLKPGQESPLVSQYKKLAEQDPAVAKAMNDPLFLATLSPARPLHVIVTKFNDVRHEERDLERGMKSELWGHGGFTAERKPPATRILVNMTSPLSEKEFPEFSWISKSNFAGTATDGGMKCMVFKEQIDPVQLLYSGSGFTGNGSTVAVTAKVDYKTRYPVSLEFGVETRTYTVIAPPAEAPSIPEDFAIAIKDMQKRNQNATPQSAPP